MTARYTDYDDWAWLYNETMGPDYCRPQLDLLKRVLLPRVPAGGRILDLCCGTGQLITPLLEAGYQVTGLDGSRQMLDMARRNAPGASYLLEDARAFESSVVFDGAFSTSASLNHVMTIEALSQVFTNVFTALRPGGVFVFDLNHPGQLAKWWRGRTTEGQIAHGFAWMIVPRYDAGSGRGEFEVTIYKASQKRGWAGWALAPWKRGLYRILRRDRFIGLRLKLLSRFASIEPGWDCRRLSYPVRGHDLEAVQAALLRAGFDCVQVQTIDGEASLDDDHSAHFICLKPVAVGAPLPRGRLSVV